MTEKVIGGFAKILHAIPKDVVVKNPNKKSFCKSPEKCFEKKFIVIDAETRQPMSITHEAYTSIINALGLEYENFFNKTLFNKEQASNMDECEYYFHQFIHYLSTYGEQLIFGKIDYTYAINNDNKTSNEITTPIYVILAESSTTLTARVEDYLYKLVSIHPDNLEYISEFIQYADSLNIDKVRSFEVRCLIYSHLNQYPKNIEEAFRYFYFKVVGIPYVIRNDSSLEVIRGYCQQIYSDRKEVKSLMDSFSAEDFAKVFYRYKDILLQFKVLPRYRSKINKISRLAKKMYQPLTNICVQNMINLPLSDAISLIPKMTNRELVKVINAIHSRDEYHRAFTIRNGSTFVSVDDSKRMKGVIHFERTELFLILYKELCQRLRSAFSGYVFYIPDYISYAVPTTEKQFTGNYPWGSFFKVDSQKQTAFGIQWSNVNDHQTDLDLHLSDTAGHRYGWNSFYRDDNGAILYSGDMTNANPSAAECYWITPANLTDPLLLTVSNFTNGNIVPTSFGISTTENPVSSNNKTVMNFDFPAIPVNVPMNLDLTLGVITKDKFIIFGGGTSHDRVPNKWREPFINIAIQKAAMQLQFDLLFADADASVFHDRKVAEAYAEMSGYKLIDLSPENLTSSVLLNLVDGIVSE